jgi:hypothetical protein
MAGGKAKHRPKLQLRAEDAASIAAFLATQN